MTAREEIERVFADYSMASARGLIDDLVKLLPLVPEGWSRQTQGRRGVPSSTGKSIKYVYDDPTAELKNYRREVIVGPWIENDRSKS